MTIYYIDKETCERKEIQWSDRDWLDGSIGGFSISHLFYPLRKISLGAIRRLHFDRSKTVFLAGSTVYPRSPDRPNDIDFFIIGGPHGGVSSDDWENACDKPYQYNTQQLKALGSLLITVCRVSPSWEEELKIMCKASWIDNQRSCHNKLWEVAGMVNKRGLLDECITNNPCVHTRVKAFISKGEWDVATLYANASDVEDVMEYLASAYVNEIVIGNSFPTLQRYQAIECMDSWLKKYRQAPVTPTTLIQNLRLPWSTGFSSIEDGYLVLYFRQGQVKIKPNGYTMFLTGGAGGDFSQLQIKQLDELSEKIKSVYLG